MINHPRVLLLNPRAEDRPPLGVDGEQYTPPFYRPARDTGPLKRARDLLLGTDPDNLTRNYKADQYLRLLESLPEARDALDAYDTRRGMPGAWYETVFGPEIGRPDSEIELTPTGVFTGDPGRGRHKLRVSLELNAALTGGRVINHTDASEQTFTANGSLPVGPLPVPGAPGTGLLLTPATTQAPSATDRRWPVTWTAKPGPGLAETLNRLTRHTDTFRQLAAPLGETGLQYLDWFVSPGAWDRRLSGALLLVIESTERARG